MAGDPDRMRQLRAAAAACGAGCGAAAAAVVDGDRGGHPRRPARRLGLLALEIVGPHFVRLQAKRLRAGLATELQRAGDVGLDGAGEVVHGVEMQRNDAGGSQRLKRVARMRGGYGEQGDLALPSALLGRGALLGRSARGIRHGFDGGAKHGVEGGEVEGKRLGAGLNGCHDAWCLLLWIKRPNETGTSTQTRANIPNYRGTPVLRADGGRHGGHVAVETAETAGLLHARPNGLGFSGIKTYVRFDKLGIVQRGKCVNTLSNFARSSFGITVKPGKARASSAEMKFAASIPASSQKIMAATPLVMWIKKDYFQGQRVALMLFSYSDENLRIKPIGEASTFRSTTALTA